MKGYLQNMGQSENVEKTKGNAMKHLTIENILDLVAFEYHRGNFEHALNLITPLADKIEKSEACPDREIEDCFSFDDLMEEILYLELNEKTQITAAETQYSTIYLVQGSILLEMGRYEAANESLKKALRWNPVSIKVRVEYMETLKKLGRMDEYFKKTIASFDYAYRSVDLARCYRNLGFYFIEELKYEEAKACYILSLQYEPDSKTALSELYLIDQKTNGKIENPTPDAMRKCAEKYGFPIGARSHVLQIAYSFGKSSLENNQNEMAEYFFTILYDLTDDADFKQILDDLKKQGG